MGLYVIATPIGTPQDIGRRAQALLQSCPVIIGEEAKPFFRHLKSFGIKALDQKEIYFLNEHSRSQDIEALLSICAKKPSALITDCGTPAFCDPGAELIARCHESHIPVHSVPGPNSLGAFLSVCGRRLDEFVFRGFLPRKQDQRKRALQALAKEERPIIVMDTPYRLKNLLLQLKEYLPPHRRLVLGSNLSTEQETLLFGTPAQILKRLDVEKAEFVLLIEKLRN